MNIERKLKRELPPKRGERVISTADTLKACTYDQRALSIIEESDFTTHNRVGIHRHVRAANIINDFFEPGHFDGKTLLEFGPGHYSFAMLARHLGAVVMCVERYPPHVELGRHLGFEVLDCDFTKLTTETLGCAVDGLWMKGAFNACNFANDAAVHDVVGRITSVIKPEGWGWNVTVNKAPDRDPQESVDHRVAVQRRAYEEHGWVATPIDEADRKRYAVSYAGSPFYFTRNLLPAGSPAASARAR